MNSKNYVLKILDNLHERYPSYTFKYQFDELDESHVIEYSPYDLVEGDKEFESKKYDILNDYYDQDFLETIVFINEFDPIGVSNPIIYSGTFCYEPTQEKLLVLESNTIAQDKMFDFDNYINYSLAA